MPLLVLDASTLAQALPMHDCIEAVAAGLADFARGAYQPFARSICRNARSPALMGLMPVFHDGDEPLWGVKDVLLAPANRALGLASHQGAMLVHDGRTGALLALLDAGTLTALRTAAASAVATRALARTDARHIAILGTGALALAHIEALRVVLPQAQFKLWGRDFVQAEALARQTGAVACADARDAVAAADVVCTVTASRVPVLQRDWLRSGCHVNAVGASARDTRELGADMLRGAEWYVDSRAQAQQECGEIHLAIAEGAITADPTRGELGELLIGACPGRSGDTAMTVFKSLGLAVEDLAAAAIALRNARRLGLGQTLRW